MVSKFNILHLIESFFTASSILIIMIKLPFFYWDYQIFIGENIDSNVFNINNVNLRQYFYIIFLLISSVLIKIVIFYNINQILLIRY
jgi:hypothetical protein